MGQIRIGLTISGAVSLGSFEGGALAALLTAAQSLQASNPGQSPPIRVDAVGAASAGSITAIAAARILTGGLEPTSVMEQAWVVQDTLNALLKNANDDAPLSMDGLSTMATGILQGGGAMGAVDPAKIQSGCDVTIHLALCNLRGLEYEIKKLSPIGTGSIDASTYFDWAAFTFSPKTPVDDFQKGAERSAVDTALASGANEFGFPPKRLARTKADYEPQGLTNFPEASNYLWFTDGGTVDNEPLGRTLDITNVLDSLDSSDPLGPEDHRVHVLIHPFPSWPADPASLAWADPDKKPSWLRTLFRAVEVIRSQNLYADVRRAEKTNSRLIWEVRLQNALDELIGALPQDQQAAWADRLKQEVDQIEADLGSMPRHRESRPITTRDNTDGSVAAQLMHVALERISGLSGKNPIGIEVISPYLAVGTAGLSLGQILAGEFLESFGGFFDEGLRRSDFALGFVCMLNWMSTGLVAYGLDPGLAETAIAAALTRFYSLGQWTAGGKTKGFTGYGLNEQLKALATKLKLTAGDSWIPTDFGEETLRSLSLGERGEVALVGARVARVVGADVWLRATNKDTVGGPS